MDDVGVLEIFHDVDLSFYSYTLRAYFLHVLFSIAFVLELELLHRNRFHCVLLPRVTPKSGEPDNAEGALAESLNDFEFLVESPVILGLILPRNHRMLILLDESLQIRVDQVDPDVIKHLHLLSRRCLLGG